jgi:hypothetical protein
MGRYDGMSFNRDRNDGERCEESAGGRSDYVSCLPKTGLIFTFSVQWTATFSLSSSRVRKDSALRGGKLGR